MTHIHNFDYERVAQLRATYIDDEKVLDFVSPDKSDVIIDIGSGDGHYSVLFSRSAGTVYAIDLNPRSKDLTEEKARKSGRENVIHILSDACHGNLPASFNKVFFGTSFHDLPCRDSLLDMLKTSRKGALRVIFLEFKKEDTPGPPEEIRIAEEELQELMIRHGFALKRSESLKIHYIQEYELRP